jgi:hypothetical protein
VTTIVPQEKDGSIGGPESAATLNLEVIGKSNADIVSLINRPPSNPGRFRSFLDTKTGRRHRRTQEFPSKSSSIFQSLL